MIHTRRASLQPFLLFARDGRPTKHVQMWDPVRDPHPTHTMYREFMHAHVPHHGRIRRAIARLWWLYLEPRLETCRLTRYGDYWRPSLEIMFHALRMFMLVLMDRLVSVRADFLDHLILLCAGTCAKFYDDDVTVRYSNATQEPFSPGWEADERKDVARTVLWNGNCARGSPFGYAHVGRAFVNADFAWFHRTNRRMYARWEFMLLTRFGWDFRVLLNYPILDNVYAYLRAHPAPSCPVLYELWLCSPDHTELLYRVARVLEEAFCTGGLIDAACPDRTDPADWYLCHLELLFIDPTIPEYVPKLFQDIGSLAQHRGHYVELVYRDAGPSTVNNTPTVISPSRS